MKNTHQYIPFAFKICLFGLLLIFIDSKAQTSQENFDLGNADYSKAKYAEAIKKYQKIIFAGECSGELFFNLGNAYYKIDSIPQAILYYEKAKIFLPTDDDLKSNLKLAKNRTTDKIEPTPQLFFVSWYQNMLQSMTPTLWAWLSIITSFITFIFFWFYIKSKNHLFKRIFFFSGLFLFIGTVFLVFLGSASHNANKTHRGVIFTPSITLKSEPNENATSLFVVHEGSTCKIVENTSIWLRVRLENGNEGWLKKTDLREI